MYNAEQKNEYLESIRYRNLSLSKWLIRTFEYVSDMESKLNKDISEWTSNEIISYYKLMSTSSLLSLQWTQCQLKLYSNWCFDKHLLSDNQVHYEEIDLNILESCINRGLQQAGILSRKELESMLNTLLNPRDKCLAYAFFEGIKGKLYSELVELNMNQVHGNELHLQTRTIPVSSAFIDLMKESTDEYIYTSYGGKTKEFSFRSDDQKVFKDIMDRGIPDEKRKRQRLYSNIMRIRDYIGNPSINATSLMESGRIDMIQKLIEKNKGMDLAELLNKYKDEISNKYGKIYSTTRYILQYGKYLETE